MLIDRYFGFLSCFPIVKLHAFQCWSRAVTKSFGTRASVTVRKQRLIYIREHWICIFRAQLERCRSLIAEKTRRRTARPCLCGRRLGGNASETRGLRDTLWYTVPRRDCPSVPCVCVYFFTSRCWRVFLPLPRGPVARCMAGPVGGETAVAG